MIGQWLINGMKLLSGNMHLMCSCVRRGRGGGIAF